MESDADFSSGGSDHDDSDTIVISSKSRILISPRKKGSKAVSKLLSSAGDDVVEQLLRGSGGRAEVVSKAKSSTMRIGGKQYVARGQVHSQATETTTNARAKAIKISAREVDNRAATTQSYGNVAAQQVQENRRTTDTHANGNRSSSMTRAQHEDATSVGDKESNISDLESGALSAPSSELDSEAEELRATEQTRARRKQSTCQFTTQSGPTRHRKESRASATKNRRVMSYEECDSFEDGEASDDSSSTKGSSLSHKEHRERRVVHRRKFDDHLGKTAHSCDATTSSKKMAVNEELRREKAPHSDSSRRKRSSRHPDSSDLDDSLILPSSATQEMEDLKQTLKNLAHNDPIISGSSKGSNTGMLLSTPPRKAASFTDATRGLGKLHNEEPAKLFDGRSRDATWSTTTALARYEDSAVNNPHKTKPSRRTRGYRSDDSASDSGHSEPSVARRLFSTPPTKVAKVLSTSPTVPINSFISKRMPSPQATPFHSSPGYTSTLDTSLASAASSSTQGSRAVLSALKALQDKIRRLEEEREKLLQELSDAKVKARKREAEFASTEKKFAYELGQTKESARAAYDAIRSEREDLKLELVKYEERRKAMEAELQHANKLTSAYSAKADDLQGQLHVSESNRKSLQAEMDSMRGAHKQEARDMRGELTALQKEKDAAKEQIKLLQQQFERESQNHADTRERLHETEQTIAGISQLNEKLVSKVWEANEIANKATKKTKKLQQSQRVSTLSRPTAASRAASISAANGSTIPGRPASATKQSRSGSAVSTGAIPGKKVKRSSQAQASNNLELLRAANLGRAIPFVLGTSANRSHSIISNVQEAIRQCDTSFATPVTNPPPTPTFLKTRKPSVRLRKASDSGTVGGQEGEHRGTSTSASILGLENPTLVGSRTGGTTSREDAASTTRGKSVNRPSAIRVPTPSTSYANPMQSQIMEDLHVAVRNAEAEFSALNQKYKDAVAKVEGGRPGASLLSTSLGPMLYELEAKGKQLNLLKQIYEQASHSTINPIRHVVHSPEAVLRKTASLRILNDYRQLEREAKSPRSATTMSGFPGSPTGTNVPSRRASFFSDNE